MFAKPLLRSPKEGSIFAKILLHVWTHDYNNEEILSYCMKGNMQWQVGSRVPGLMSMSKPNRET
jgi:hypothetical protein